MGSTCSLQVRFWVALGHTWAPCELNLEPLGHLLGSTSSLLGSTWSLLGASWAQLGRSWAPLELNLAAFEGFWASVGPTWAPSGLQMASKWPPSGLQVLSKWPPSGLQVDARTSCKYNVPMKNARTDSQAQHYCFIAELHCRCISTGAR